jgi:hypothetical protein
VYFPLIKRLSLWLQSDALPPEITYDHTNGRRSSFGRQTKTLGHTQDVTTTGAPSRPGSSCSLLTIPIAHERSHNHLNIAHKRVGRRVHLPRTSPWHPDLNQQPTTPPVQLAQRYGKDMSVDKPSMTSEMDTTASSPLALPAEHGGRQM